MWNGRLQLGLFCVRTFLWRDLRRKRLSGFIKRYRTTNIGVLTQEGRWHTIRRRQPQEVQCLSIDAFCRPSGQATGIKISVFPFVSRNKMALTKRTRFLVVDWNVWGVHVLDAYVAHLPLTGTLFTHVTFTWEESLGNMTYQCPQWWALEQFNKGCRVGMLVLVICFVYSLAYCLELLHESLLK